MKALAWLGLASLGMGLMIVAYTGRARPAAEARWAHGMIVVDPPDATSEESTLVPAPGATRGTRVRFLDATTLDQLLIRSLEQRNEGGSKSFRALVSPKLYWLDPADVGFTAAGLASGRLPERGRDEVLAGPNNAPPPGSIQVGDRSLTVVGVLRSDARLFQGSYLLPATPGVASLFDDSLRSVHRAVLIGLTRSQADDHALLDRIDQRYPAAKSIRFSPMARLARATFLTYLAGQVLLLLGGTGALLGLYGWLAGRALPAWFHAPLAEIAARPRFLWAVHTLYFGLFVVGTLVIYEFPSIQALLITSVREQIAPDGRGVLALAGKAYASKNVAYAAAVTFLVNYLVGTWAQITGPALILPGLGTMLGVVRPLLWGVLLGPIFEATSGGMIPHSITLLLEGEGYILAFAFGLLVPYYLMEPRLGPTVAARWRRVIVLNARASALVAAVLLVAAVYEAIEVIAMMG